MSGKDENPDDVAHESSTDGFWPVASYVEKCLCGCGQATDGRTLSHVDEHDAGLVNSIIADEYGSIAEFVTTHSAGMAANAHWRLTPWQPTTDIGQQARGRVFWPISLHFHGLAELEISDHGDDETESLYSKISDAGARLDAELGDPFRQQKYEHYFRTAGPVWDTARRKLLTLYKRRQVPSSNDKDELLAYMVDQSNLEEAFKQAPDAPTEFVVPGQAAFNVLQSGLPEQAEKMLRDATESYVLDVDSWAILAAEAFKADRLDDALGFAEAAVAVAERSLPDRFSGTLRSNWFDNNNYLLGRRVLMFVLWKLNRFDDAYRFAVDTVWLDPQDEQKIRLYLGHIKLRVPFSDAFFPGDSPI